MRAQQGAQRHSTHQFEYCVRICNSKAFKNLKRWFIFSMRNLKCQSNCSMIRTVVNFLNSVNFFCINVIFFYNATKSMFFDQAGKYMACIRRLLSIRSSTSCYSFSVLIRDFQIARGKFTAF